MSWTDEDASAWEEKLQTSGSKTCWSVLKQAGLPSRLAEALLQEASGSASNSLADRKTATLTKKEKATLLQKLIGYTLPCTGHEGYPKARPLCQSCGLKYRPTMYGRVYHRLI